MAATLPQECPPMNELANLRKAAGFTQAQIAALLEVTPTAVSIVEAGHRTPSMVWRRRYRLALVDKLEELGTDTNPYQRIVLLALENGGNAPGRWITTRIRTAHEVEQALQFRTLNDWDETMEGAA